MPAITALLHTHNDAVRLGRCLETLYPCDEIVIVDHGSNDGTIQLAREYGARVIEANADPSTKLEPSVIHNAALAPSGWILALDPRESVSEALAASLYEIKSGSVRTSLASALSVFLREETLSGWVRHPAPQARVVASNWITWEGTLPTSKSSGPVLEGEILRFAFP
jgi:glycosyltransferase involved in cell wall biosynthesis